MTILVLGARWLVGAALVIVALASFAGIFGYNEAVFGPRSGMDFLIALIGGVVGGGLLLIVGAAVSPLADRFVGGDGAPSVSLSGKSLVMMAVGVVVVLVVGAVAFQMLGSAPSRPDEPAVSAPEEERPRTRQRETPAPEEAVPAPEITDLPPLEEEVGLPPLTSPESTTEAAPAGDPFTAPPEETPPAQ